MCQLPVLKNCLLSSWLLNYRVVGNGRTRKTNGKNLYQRKIRRFISFNFCFMIPAIFSYHKIIMFLLSFTYSLPIKQFLWVQMEWFYCNCIVDKKIVDYKIYGKMLSLLLNGEFTEEIPYAVRRNKETFCISCCDLSGCDFLICNKCDGQALVMCKVVNIISYFF